MFETIVYGLLALVLGWVCGGVFESLVQARRNDRLSQARRRAYLAEDLIENVCRDKADMEYVVRQWQKVADLAEKANRYEAAETAEDRIKWIKRNYR